MSETTATSERRDALRGILSMLLSVLVFGLMAALVKLASEQQPIGQIIFFRNAFAFIPLYFFVRRAGGFPALRTRYPRQHVVRVIAGVASMALDLLCLRPDAAGRCGGHRALGPDLPHQPVGADAGREGRLAALERRGGGLHRHIDHHPAGQRGLRPRRAGPPRRCGILCRGHDPDRKVGTREPAATMTFYYTLCAALLAAASLPWQWVTPTPSMLVCLTAIGLLGGVAQVAVTEAYRLAPVSLIAPFEYTALVVAAVFG